MVNVFPAGQWIGLGYPRNALAEREGVDKGYEHG